MSSLTGAERGEGTVAVVQDYYKDHYTPPLPHVPLGTSKIEVAKKLGAKCDCCLVAVVEFSKINAKYNSKVFYSTQLLKSQPRFEDGVLRADLLRRGLGLHQEASLVQ